MHDLNFFFFCCCRILYGDQARYFEDEIKRDSKHKKVRLAWNAQE